MNCPILNSTSPTFIVHPFTVNPPPMFVSMVGKNVYETTIAFPLVEYFDHTEKSQSGTCKLCHKNVQFKGVSSNLVTHLRVRILYSNLVYQDL